MRFLLYPRPGKGVCRLSHLREFRISFSILFLILAKAGGLRTYCGLMLGPCPSSGRAGYLSHGQSVFLYCWGHQQQLLACPMPSVVIGALS